MGENVACKIFKGLPLSSPKKDRIRTALTKVEVKKSTLILETGGLILYQYFVPSGCLRSFFVDPHRKEPTVQFAVRDL